MSRYLLDTTALIDFSKTRQPATEYILHWIAVGDVVAVCAVTVGEFYAGLAGDRAQEALEFVTSLPYWDISRRAAMHAGQDRYTFARQGKALSISDALIAAAAREHHATVVTSNVKDFPMTDIAVFPL